MTKSEFISILEKKLEGIPKEDIKNTIEYYNEIIMDKQDEGVSEEEVIESLGTIDEIVNFTLSEIPVSKLVKEKLNLNRKLKIWEIVLLTITSIIWAPLLLVLLVVILSIYLCLWSGVIALGSVSVSCLASSLISIPGIIDIFTSDFSSGILLIAVGMMMLGFGILLGLLTIKLAKIMVVLCKKIVLKIKTYFVKKGEKYES